MRNIDPDSEENQRQMRENAAYIKALQNEQLIARHVGDYREEDFPDETESEKQTPNLTGKMEGGR